MRDYWATRDLHWGHLWWLARHVRGIARDRLGRYYWCTVEEYSPGHFLIRLTPWPGLSFFSQAAGWISLGSLTTDPATWLIFDVQVHRDRQRGVGTLLVRAGIALAQQKRASELRGFVTADDASEHPFLPAWYARLGFTVALNRSFSMQLAKHQKDYPNT